MSAVAYKLPAHPERPTLALVPPPEREAAGVYLRRRIVAAVVASLLVLALYPTVGAIGDVVRAEPARLAPAADVAGPSAEVWTVRPGDSLWSIATAARPGEDPRPLVQQLTRARNGAPLQPGEKIVLP